MITLLPIHSLDLPDLQPDLQPYRTLRRPLDHQRQGIFVAEGEKVVRRLLESKLTVISLLVTPEWLTSIRLHLESRPEDVAVFLADKKLLESIVGFNLHQGIMAVARIPDPLPIDQVLDNCRSPYLLVAIDGLTGVENLGVLVRNCVAFGVQAIIVGETSSSPYLRRAVRNSMGTIFKLPVVHVTSLAQALTDMRQRFGIRSIATDPHATEERIEQVDLKSGCCLVFGSEGEGIRPNVLEACDERVAIPMQSNVDSLNVASASAVFLYEAYLQRIR